MERHNLIIAQGGGPTAVINASLAGVVSAGTSVGSPGSGGAVWVGGASPGSALPPGPSLGGVGSIDRHLHGAVVDDRDVVGLDPLLALHASTIGDPELPVVPGAGDQVAVEFALGQAVALVGTGVVDGVQAVASAHEAHAVAVDLDHLHGADGEVVDVQIGVTVEVLVVGVEVGAEGCVHDRAR